MMATKDEIKKAILRVAGNPVSGAIKSLADEFADAIVALDAPADGAPEVVSAKGSSEQRNKETRVIGAVERR